MPLVPVYSIAKTFTAAAVLTAKVDLDRCAGEFLDLPAVYQPLSLRDLLRHTSGLGDYFALSEYRDAVKRGEDAWSDAELLERGLSAPPAIAGTFRYSNIGYTLVRKVMETIFGAEFFDALNASVFSPLGITDIRPLRSRADWESCEQADAAVRAYDPQWVYPRTFLASADAIAAGFTGLLRGELFDPALLLDGVVVDAPGHSFREPKYGLGIMMDGDRFVGHGGGGPGFALFALAYRDGSAAHLEYRVTDTDEGDAALIEAGVRTLQILR